MDGRDPQRDRRPDEDGMLGLAHVEFRLGRQSKFPVAQPRANVPKSGQLLARTVQNVDTMEYSEKRRIVAGLSKEELTGKMPMKGRRQTCSDAATAMVTSRDGWNGWK